MTRDGRPGTLHPGGFGHVPIALQRDPRAKPEHIGVYAAISGALDFSRGEGEVRRRRIVERSKRGRGTVLRAVADLVSWGYVETHERPGRPTLFRVMPTGPVDLVAERRADAVAADPTKTGRLGGKSKGRPSEGTPLPGAGSMRKGRPGSEPTPQKLRTTPVSRRDAISPFDPGGVPAERSMLAAVAHALGHDPDRITRNHRSGWTGVVRDLLALGVVPAEVPFRVEAFEQIHGRACRTPTDLSKFWGTLRSATADRARALRETLVADGWDDDVDATVLEAITTNSDGQVETDGLAGQQTRGGHA